MLLTAHEVAERPDRSKRRVQMKGRSNELEYLRRRHPSRVARFLDQDRVHSLKFSNRRPSSRRSERATTRSATSVTSSVPTARTSSLSPPPVHRSKNERERLFQRRQTSVIDEHRWPLQARPAVKPGRAQ